MNKLLEALNIGKRRGYQECRKINGEESLFQYAIKKQNGMYCTYFFMVESSRMQFIEDDENEEIKEFISLDAALRYLVGKGAEIEKFTVIKGILPF